MKIDSTSSLIQNDHGVGTGMHGIEWVSLCLMICGLGDGCVRALSGYRIWRAAGGQIRVQASFTLRLFNLKYFSFAISFVVMLEQ